MSNFAFLSELNLEALSGFLCGFLVFAFLRVWVTLSARWVNWFPLLARITRFMLYAAALAGLLFTLSRSQQAPSLEIFFGTGIVGFMGFPVLRKLIYLFRPRERLKRGGSVHTAADVNSAAAKVHPSADFEDCLVLGGVKVPLSAEPLHFLVTGATGTGKSVAIKSALDNIRARGDLALVVDSGGEFAERYYTPGCDAILNPFDARCAPWSPTAEMEGPWDAESLAKSMVPDGVGDAKEWNGYAQTLITSILRKLHEQRNLSITTLLYYAQAATTDELGELLAGTAAAAQLTNDRTLGSIRTIASNYLSTYSYLTESKDPFSVARFVREGRAGFLFLTYRDDQLASLKNMIACALDIASRTTLSLSPNSKRRVWLVIDEAASIGAIQSISAFATKSRKFGGCLLLGLQTVSQLKDLYGENGAQTILSCLSSWLVLRSADPETAEFISRYIGEAEVSRMTRGESSSAQGATDSLSEQIQLKRLVLPAELQALANLQGYFRLAGGYPVARIKLTFPPKNQTGGTPYAPRDFKAAPMLSLQPGLLAAAPTSTSTSQASSLGPGQAEGDAREDLDSVPGYRQGRVINLDAPDLDWAVLGFAPDQEDGSSGEVEVSAEGLEGTLLSLAAEGDVIGLRAELSIS